MAAKINRKDGIPRNMPQRRSSTSGNSFYKAFSDSANLSDRKVRIVYSLEVAKAFAARYANGENLLDLFNVPAFPSRSNYFYWKVNHEEFRRMMEVAEKIRAETYAVKLEHVADTVDASTHKQAKVRADIMRHLAGAYDPDKFGARTKITGDKNQPLAFTVVTGVPDANEPIDCSKPALAGPPEDKEGFDE